MDPAPDLEPCCDDCHRQFENRLELLQHYAEVHDRKWTGRANLSQSGDEEAVGAVSPDTSDYMATRGNRDRPSAEERARDRQEGDYA